MFVHPIISCLPCHEWKGDRNGWHVPIGQQVFVVGLLLAAGHPIVDADQGGDQEHQEQHQVVRNTEQILIHLCKKVSDLVSFSWIILDT